jgi:pantothenate kinase
MNKIKENMSTLYNVNKSDKDNIDIIDNMVELSDHNNMLNNNLIKIQKSDRNSRLLKESYIANTDNIDNSSENIQSLVDNYNNNNENDNKIIVTGSGVFTTKIHDIKGGMPPFIKQHQLRIVLCVCIILLLMLLIYIHYKIESLSNLLISSMCRYDVKLLV